MGLFKRKKKPRVCVIGLDGVPFEMLTDLSDRAIMPAFKKLRDNGNLHSMKASLPEISSVSWTDFMTGTNAGTHGIFGFTDFKKGSYDLRFPNFMNVQTDTIWDILGRKKKRSVVINQPSTYPARRINGALISGFVALELGKAVYPISLKERLNGIGYEIDIDTFKARQDHAFLWKELDRTLAGREKAYEILWEEDWDYFEFVITGTDRLQHFLWDAYLDENHPDHELFLNYYRSVDRLVARIVGDFQKLTGGNEGLYLLSDHGFTAIKQEVYLNTWLRKENFLSFKTEEPKDLAQINPASRAFAMDPNRIYIHDSTRFPNGSVSPEDRQSVKDEIISALESIECEGERVVRRIFDTREIYSGPLVDDGPDLIVLSEYGYDMKGSVKQQEIFGRSNLQGMHTWDNAFFWASRSFGDDIAISQLSEIILDHFQ